MEWLSPDKYLWEYRLPHETDPKKYYHVKEGELAQYNAFPLLIRVSCQVIPGPKLQVFLVCAPAESKVTELGGSMDKSFPLIFLEKFSVPFLPYESAGSKLGMGPIPYMIDTRDELDSSEVGSSLPDGQVIKESMSKFVKYGIKPNQRNEIKTWTKEMAVGTWVARAPNHTWPNSRDDAGDAEEDDAGQQNICKK